MRLFQVRSDYLYLGLLVLPVGINGFLNISRQHCFRKVRKPIFCRNVVLKLLNMFHSQDKRRQSRRLWSGAVLVCSGYMWNFPCWTCPSWATERKGQEMKPCALSWTHWAKQISNPILSKESEHEPQQLLQSSLHALLDLLRRIPNFIWKCAKVQRAYVIILRGQAVASFTVCVLTLEEHFLHFSGIWTTRSSPHLLRPNGLQNEPNSHCWGTLPLYARGLGVLIPMEIIIWPARLSVYITLLRRIRVNSLWLISF